jgi:hypothetical protein
MNVNEAPPANLLPWSSLLETISRPDLFRIVNISKHLFA